jgi:hypothetical protein
MRAGGLGGGPCKTAESRREHFSVSTIGSPTKRVTRAVRRLKGWKGSHHEISAHLGGHQEHEHP